MRNHLILGDWNVLCDSCGRKFKASQVQRRWDGMIVCKEDYELRHPQDFLRVQKERISVPFVRPYPAQDTFIPVNLTQLVTETTVVQETFVKDFTKYIGQTTVTGAYTFNAFALNSNVLNKTNATSSTNEEIISFTETLLVSLARFLSDTVNASETVAKTFGKMLAESVSFVETQTFTVTKPLTDSFSISETTALVLSKAVTESLSVSETITSIIGSATVLNGAVINKYTLG